MEKNLYQEYTDFQEFYDDCKTAVNSVRQVFKGNIKQTVNFIRSNYEKEFLNAYYSAAELPPYLVKVLQSNTAVIKFSADTMIKNILEHPEITVSEYLNIRKYVKNAEYILLKNTKNLIYFKIEDKIYQFVIKTTKDGCENFITTFHKSGIKQLEKDLKRYKRI